MKNVDRIELDYINQIRPLLADCIYYYGLSPAFPQILILLCRRFVWINLGERIIGLITEKVPPKLLQQSLRPLRCIMEQAA
jgi:hypothetical protein